MLKLPKGLKKKKKKSKKDHELFTEEELEQYKRELKAKQESSVAKSEAGDSDVPSDVESVASTSAGTHQASAAQTSKSEDSAKKPEEGAKSEQDEEWKKFKALTSGIDTVLHKTQDELDRIKKESFYQRLPTEAEKKKLEEEEAAKRREEEERRRQEEEAKKDKLKEAVIELSDFEEDEIDVGDDIFATEYIDAITSGEVQLAVVPDSPILEEVGTGDDPFDTTYAEQVIVGANKSGKKKLVSLGAAVEVLSGRVDREQAIALAKPKKKLRKGIKNLLLSESLDLDAETEIETAEPQINLLDELVNDVPEPVEPIDLTVSLHLKHLPSKPVEPEETYEEDDVLSEFDTLKNEECDDEFAELAAASLTKKEVIENPLPLPVIPTEIPTEVETNWSEFENDRDQIFIENLLNDTTLEDTNLDDDIFNTTYAEQVIKKTTVLEEDDDFDPRAADETPASFIDTQTNHFQVRTQRSEDEQAEFARRKSSLNLSLNSKAVGFLIPDPHSASQEVDHLNKKKPVTPYYAPDLASVADADPFNTSFVTNANTSATGVNNTESVLSNKTTLSHSLSDPDFDPRALTSTHLTEELLSVQENISVKVLTPSLEPNSFDSVEKEYDPFDTSIATDLKPGKVELKILETEFLPTKTRSISPGVLDSQSDAQELGLGDKVLTPLKPLTSIESVDDIDPFDTSIADNLALGKTEIKLLESELINN